MPRIRGSEDQRIRGERTQHLSPTLGVTGTCRTQGTQVSTISSRPVAHAPSHLCGLAL